MIYRLLILKFVIIMSLGGSLQAQNQTAHQKYFPPFVLPETWFEQIDAIDFYHKFSNASDIARLPIMLKGSNIRFYPNQFQLNTYTFKTNVSIALVNRGVGYQALNAYNQGFIFAPRSGVNLNTLPVIYKKQPLIKLARSFKGIEAITIDKHLAFNQNPGGGDTLQAFFSDESYSRNGLMRRVFYETPWLVEFDWHEIPESPIGNRRRDGLARRSTRDNIVEYFQVERVEPVATLDRVETVTSPWSFSGSENINFSQVYLRNWTRGGQNSIALLSDLRLNATYTRENVTWENTARHKLGIIAQEGSRARVNDDLFDISSKYGVNASQKWYYSLLFSFRSQFFNGYARNDINMENPISAFMAPGYFSLAAGMDYKRKNFTLMLSPVTSRLVVVLDTAKIDPARYNIPEGKRSLFLTGASLQNNFRWDLSKDISFTSALNAFYDYFEEDENIQAEWDMILNMRVNVFLSTRIVGNLRYFETESDQLQVRQSLSVAFTYNF